MKKLEKHRIISNTHTKKKKGKTMLKNENITNQKFLKAATVIVGIIANKKFKNTVNRHPYLSFTIPIQNADTLRTANMHVICFENDAINLNHFQNGDFVAVGGLIGHYFENYCGKHFVRITLLARAIAKVQPLGGAFEYKITGEIFGNKYFLQEFERVAC